MQQYLRLKAQYPDTLLFYRMALALPLFLFMAGWAARREGAGSKRAPLSRGDALKLMGLGFIGYYLSSFLDFWGLEYISASLERLILYLTPSAVLLLAWVLQGRRASGRQWAAMALAYFGLVLVFEEWGWRPLSAFIARLAKYAPIAAVERLIANLPPYAALFAIALPTVLLVPLKSSDGYPSAVLIAGRLPAVPCVAW